MVADKDGIEIAILFFEDNPELAIDACFVVGRPQFFEKEPGE
jgi:hypothetical protein